MQRSTNVERPGGHHKESQMQRWALGSAGNTKCKNAKMDSVENPNAKMPTSESKRKHASAISNENLNARDRLCSNEEGQG